MEEEVEEVEDCGVGGVVEGGVGDLEDDFGGFGEG